MDQPTGLAWNHPFRILYLYQNGGKIAKDLNEDILKQDGKGYFSNLGIHSRIRLFIEEYCHLSYNIVKNMRYTGTQRMIAGDFW